MPTPHYGQPRYRVIADDLRERIDDGVIQSGTLLPPESVLAAEFHAARGTIRKAIDVLRRDGYATTEHGRGTYATKRNLDHAGQQETRQREVSADVRLAALFGVEVGAKLIERETVIRRDNRVEVVLNSYRLCPRSRS
ncbi:GntR family transcriptional regulator [Verrucosispora sp. WMMA2044]|uniref:GntR family transcriptional regulator n=1 Tax=Verrucosispora sp. WMMA2044 TaxID=3016419 RepID=UPI00248ACE2B|nr:GntR family transcriptional regulator [Verrucosispora sp. WMMA2044]WBB49784.1 GntR family transcriptional regulator [Verrucosispora sp. WMMA2044]